MPDEAELFKKRLEYIEASLAELRDEIDRRGEEVRSQADRQRDIVSEKIINIQNAVKELQLMIYGEPRYRLAGLSDQIGQMNKALETMQDEREALRNQIKGMSLLIKILVALAGGGTVAAVGALLEWFSK